MGLNGRRHCSVSCPPTKTKEPSQKQKNADPDHGAQNRGKSTQNEGKELLSPDSREVDRSMISPSISPAAHQDDVERKKQKHPLRLQQAQAQTLKLDEVRQPIQGTPTALPVLPPLAIPFSETPPTTAKSEAHGEHHALPEIQENAKTLERREEETEGGDLALKSDSLAPHSDHPTFHQRLPNPFCRLLLTRSPLLSSLQPAQSNTCLTHPRRRHHDLRVAKIGSAPILNPDPTQTASHISHFGNESSEPLPSHHILNRAPGKRRDAVSGIVRTLKDDPSLRSCERLPLQAVSEF
ncbi:hypothetical protein BLNAU_9888 [Blattamonas nauphoetae]|uniref:Uncharacterized protein n=1 Tax=Blattamonas nauphoetae TaxID=2049346 RepID=A0ABQ9XUK3_9EUKA|nr:hypothetical protein BLNAU_9888 [Blattamonas nauphoetae]